MNIKNKKLIYRIDIITKRKFLKNELLRFIVIDNKLMLDNDNYKSRGYYIYPCKDNYDILIKTRKLNKITKTEFDISFWKQISNLFERN